MSYTDGKIPSVKLLNLLVLNEAGKLKHDLRFNIPSVTRVQHHGDSPHS